MSLHWRMGKTEWHRKKVIPISRSAKHRWHKNSILILFIIIDVNISPNIKFQGNLSNTNITVSVQHLQPDQLPTLLLCICHFRSRSRWYSEWHLVLDWPGQCWIFLCRHWRRSGSCILNLRWHLCLHLLQQPVKLQNVYMRITTF